MKTHTANLRRSLQSVLRAQHHIYRALQYYARLPKPLRTDLIHSDLNALVKFIGVLQEDLTTELEFHTFRPPKKQPPEPAPTQEEDLPF